jgi:hypothetical protein
MRNGRTDEISLAAIANRWAPFFKDLPELAGLSPKQLASGKRFSEGDEARRREAINNVVKPNSSHGK